jgi:two-component sensor histidine kinase
MSQIPFSFLLKSELKVYCVLMALVFTTPSVKGQVLAFLPDSVKNILVQLPESRHDSIYLKIGGKLYSQLTAVSLIQALDCYKKCLALAEKYNHKAMLAEAHQRVGSVYDANGNNPELMLYFFKKAYDLSEGLPDTIRLDYVYCMIIAYNLLHDTVQAIYYLEIMKKIGYKIYQKGTEEWDNFNLQLANTAASMGQNYIGHQLMEQVNKERKYKNGRFPYRQYYLYNASGFYAYKGETDKAVKVLTDYLEEDFRHDPSIAAHIANIYKYAGRYKEAVKWWEIHEDWNNKKDSENANRDLRVQYLKTENEFKEKERLIQETQNRYLIAGLLFAFVLAGIAAYYWYSNRKDKMELSLRNKEKELLVNEIHHRVKNNLQLMYSLATLQLPTISDKKAKDLWQKNLNQLKSMSLVNEKLYNTEGVTSFELKGFIQELVEHFKTLHGDYKNALFDLQFKGDLTVNADFAVPFGLILSELITNSFKHAGENGSLPIHIFMERKDSKNLVFNYSDNGKVDDLSLILDKKIGGVSLINDLVRQLEGEVSVSNEKYLQYNFTFSI